MGLVICSILSVLNILEIDNMEFQFHEKKIPVKLKLDYRGQMIRPYIMSGKTKKKKQKQKKTFVIIIFLIFYSKRKALMNTFDLVFLS